MARLGLTFLKNLIKEFVAKSNNNESRNHEKKEQAFTFGQI